MKSQNKKEGYCPLCKSNARFLFKKNKHDFFECLSCRFKFIYPLPKSAEIEKYYQDEYWDSAVYRGESSLGYASYLGERDSILDYFQKILEGLKKAYPKLNGRVLDIGCSFGLFLELAQKENWEIYGLDLSPTPVKKAKKRLGTKNIFNVGLEKAKFKDCYFDLVTIFQTIEHVDNLEKFLNEIHRILKPKGVILITTPNASGWQAKIMGSSWFAYRHPDHLSFFNFENLRTLLKKKGFVNIRAFKDPTRLYPFGYLLENVKFYYRGKFLVGLSNVIKRIVGPLGVIKIPIPLVSIVLTAQKK
ncbi:MAG: class I SAM-dependent methyltransferase [bacterium]|nr:class I SAM-dependent methyltransferase [bacterium]